MTNSMLIKNIKPVFHRVENIVEKGGNAGYQHFLLFPQYFQVAFSLRDAKSPHLVIKG